MVRIAMQAPSPTLSANLERRPGVAVVDVTGELDLDGAPILCAAIESAALDEHVVVDLSRVGFCDSTGLKALLDAAREIAARGRRLVVVAPEDGPVRRVIAMTGAEEFLFVTADREPVVSALTRG
jgi:anti-sigma B factor antagonist